MSSTVRITSFESAAIPDFGNVNDKCDKRINKIGTKQVLRNVKNGSIVDQKRN